MDNVKTKRLFLINHCKQYNNYSSVVVQPELMSS